MSLCLVSFTNRWYFDVMLIMKSSLVNYNDKAEYKHQFLWSLQSGYFDWGSIVPFNGVCENGWLGHNLNVKCCMELSVATENPLELIEMRRALCHSPGFYTEPDIGKWKECEMPFMSSKCVIINHFTEGYPILYLNTYIYIQSIGRHPVHTFGRRPSMVCLLYMYIYVDNWETSHTDFWETSLSGLSFSYPLISHY